MRIGSAGEVGLIGCRAAQARVWSSAVVKVQVTADRARLGHADPAGRYTSSYLTLRQSRSTKTLSRQAPLPSMLIRNPVFGEHAGEGRARELRTLVGVEDILFAVTRTVFKRT